MRTLFVYSILLASLFVFACNSHTEDQRTLSINQVVEDFHETHRKFCEGDTQAYNDLAIHCLDYSVGNCLHYHMFMSNRHKHPRASYEVFRTILIDYPSRLAYPNFEEGVVDDCTKIDSTTYAIALIYLRRAYMQGFNIDTVQELRRICVQ